MCRLCTCTAVMSQLVLFPHPHEGLQCVQCDLLYDIVLCQAVPPLWGMKCSTENVNTKCAACGATSAWKLLESLNWDMGFRVIGSLRKRLFERCVTFPSHHFLVSLFVSGLSCCRYVSANGAITSCAATLQGCDECRGRLAIERKFKGGQKRSIGDYGWRYSSWTNSRALCSESVAATRD